MCDLCADLVVAMSQIARIADTQILGVFIIRFAFPPALISTRTLLPDVDCRKWEIQSKYVPQLANT